MAKAKKNSKSVDVVTVTKVDWAREVELTTTPSVVEIKEAILHLEDSKRTLCFNMDIDPQAKIQNTVDANIKRLQNLVLKMVKKSYLAATKDLREAQKAAKVAARDKKREEKKIEKKAKLEDQIAKLQAKMEKLQGK